MSAVTRLGAEQRARLSESASRLYTAVRYIDDACNAHDVQLPTVLTTWPTAPRRASGWGRSTDSDQAEDERLHEVIAGGRPSVALLEERAPLDPTACLARSFFDDAAMRYERTSATAHETLREPHVSVAVSARGLHVAVTGLLHAIRDAEEVERAMRAARLVPPVLAVAADHLLDDFALLGEPPGETSGSDQAQLRLARDLDGTLGIIHDRADCLPESVLGSAQDAATALDLWDRATGSFRPPHGHDLVDSVRRSAAARASYGARSQEAELLTRAEGQLAHRLELALAAVLNGARWRGGSQPPEAIQALVRESHWLRDGGLAPPALPARDDVYRDHALRVGAVTLDVAADHLDTVEPDRLMVGRAALEAGRAAREYLAASDALAARVRLESLRIPSADQPGDRLETAAWSWYQVDQALGRAPASNVAAAELKALAMDLEWAQAEDGVPATGPDRMHLLTALDRRLVDSLRGVLDGDAGAHLAARPGGDLMLHELEATCARFDAELGVAHAPAYLFERPINEWLAEGGVDAARTRPAIAPDGAWRGASSGAAPRRMPEAARGRFV